MRRIPRRSNHPHGLRINEARAARGDIRAAARRAVALWLYYGIVVAISCYQWLSMRASAAFFGLEVFLFSMFGHAGDLLAEGMLCYSQVIVGEHGCQRLKVAARQPRPSTVTLNITYSERVAVPKGSMLLINVSNPSGAEKANKTVRTRSGGPPYSVKMQLPRADGVPLWVFDVVLQSTVGHRFSKKEVISSEALHGRTPIEVRLELN
jgi:hypothetical protein